MPVRRLFLFDSFGFIFRAYHARARTGAPPMRTSTGMQTEAVYIFTNMVRRVLKAHQPDHVAAIFESRGPNVRTAQFTDYKANRVETPQELLDQIPYVRKMLDAMRIPVLEFNGYEADDVIGTLAQRASAAGYEVVIVSSDKDMLQLVGDSVRMLNPVKDDEIYDAVKVEEFMGVTPRQVTDLLALKGDAVDNIPGAPGIGDKGARDLIRKYGSVEETLARAAEVERKMYRESLLANREQIELSKRLATIATDLPVECELDQLCIAEPDLESIARLYKELEFYSLLKELKPPEPDVPLELRMLETSEAVEAWLDALPEDAVVSVAMGSEGEGILKTSRLGLSSKAGEAYGVSAELLPALQPMLEDGNRPKAAHDYKALLVDLSRRGLRPEGFRDDTMLYAFLLSADPGSSTLEIAATRYLDRKPSASVEEAAACVWQLAGVLAPEIDARQLRRVYDEIDLPLSPVLARMECNGIRIDPPALRTLGTTMESEIDRLCAEICALAGHTFNPNSPQQLAKVLFEEMKLPAPTIRGKGKTMSTAADVLESLAEEHRIARMVLDYRQLVKLKGTYVDALPALLDPSTGRLHTTFNQAGAATGRLSSSNPNLQNIPIRTELGRQIRAAFVPEPGWKLVVADYSQIELRLLAHFSRDPVLMEAFRQGEDIHTRTAAEVFGVMPLMVTPDLRRAAKAVNFGIVYGLSAFGLAQQLGISRTEAETYIRNYFERYAGVRRFIDATIAEVRKTGVTKTLFGRERPIPDMNTRNANARGFAERTAVNTPLQGTAADLIKLAMIRIDSHLQRDHWKARLLLQVHDELVLEAPPDEVDRLSGLVKHEMENVWRIEVPLIAETCIGDNWRDAK
jgi:DNA polymerase-1